MAQLSSDQPQPMSSYQFTDLPAVRHLVHATKGDICVDGTSHQIRNAAPGCFVATVDGRSERLYAVAHGDTVHVQLRGRAWQIERVDPARSARGGGATGAGACRAPMPGVVISLLVSPGQQVARNDALLVIESMKLQMTISAEVSGEVAELPLAVGQTFQRGDLLARVQATEHTNGPTGMEAAA
jgi:biotin carboxyl carrier protein